MLFKWAVYMTNFYEKKKMLEEHYTLNTKVKKGIY